MAKGARIAHRWHDAPIELAPTERRRARLSIRLLRASAGGLVVVGAIAVVGLLAGRSSPKPPPPAPVPAADRDAPAALVQAARAVGFHPTTEPGVGRIEGRPASARQSPTNPNLLATGSIAPLFTLRTPQGAAVSLPSYRGKPVLLEFFASWCPHCNAEAPHLASLARSLGGKAQILSVDADGETAPSVFAFHRYFGLPYPALVDPSSRPGSFLQPGGAGPVTTAYRVAVYPTFYVLDPEGRIHWRGDGEQPDALLRQQLLQAAAPGNTVDHDKRNGRRPHVTSSVTRPTERNRRSRAEQEPSG